MDRETFREIVSLLKPIKRKVQLVASKLVVDRVNDALGLQSVQATALDEEVVEGEHMQPGGLTHVPLAGAEGVLLSIGGVRDDAVCLVVTDRRHRPRGLDAGETALYNVGAAQTVLTIKTSGDVEVTLAPGAAMKVDGDSNAAARASAVDALIGVLLSWVVTPADGGAALKAAVATAFPTFAAGLPAPLPGLTTSASDKIKTGDIL